MSMVRFHPTLRPLMVPMEGLTQHPLNANNADMEALRESILANGFYAPIIIDGDGVILAGNHRYQVLHEFGETHIPAIRVDAQSEQGKRIMLADNRITRLGRDDPGLMLELLRDLQQTEQGLLGTGYQIEDLDQIAGAAEVNTGFGGGFGVSGRTVQVELESPDDARDLEDELRDRGLTVVRY